MRFVSTVPIAALVALAMWVAPTGATAQPGATLVAERARLAALGALTPLAADSQSPGRYEAHPTAGPSLAAGDDGGWSLTVLAPSAVVTSESLTVRSHDPAYRIQTSGRVLIMHAFGLNTTLDLAASIVVATQHDDPSITQTFRRGAHFAYRIVDDDRNAMHLIEVMTLASLPDELRAYNAVPPTSAPGVSVTTANVPTGSGDAIFALSAQGRLVPVAVRRNGSFYDTTIANATIADQLRLEALASIAVHGDRVHIIFGNRTVATTTATIANGTATTAIPPSLHLGGPTAALASPTLGAAATHARRPPTSSERTTALALAAHEVHTTPTNLTVIAMTAIELNGATAIIGTLNDRGTGKPRRDKRLFFIAEPRRGSLVFTLANIQTITVTEPLLEEVNEYVIDALNLDAHTTAVVTQSTGYDADTYNIYTRNAAGNWQKAYTGGGTAN
jgi:hypothetical protein